MFPKKVFIVLIIDVELGSPNSLHSSDSIFRTKPPSEISSSKKCLDCNCPVRLAIAKSSLVTPLASLCSWLASLDLKLANIETTCRVALHILACDLLLVMKMSTKTWGIDNQGLPGQRLGCVMSFLFPRASSSQRLELGHFIKCLQTSSTSPRSFGLWDLHILEGDLLGDWLVASTFSSWR